MKPLAKDIIDYIDSYSGTVLSDFYVPQGRDGADRMARVEANSRDLNLIMPMSDFRREDAARGTEEAFAVVLTDVAMRISADLVASRDAGDLPDLDRHPQFDHDIAFDPQRYNDREPDREPASWRVETPYDGAFREGAVPAANAVRLAEVAERAFPDGREGKGPGDRLLDNRILLFADRIERVERQRGLSTDPEAAGAYDVVASDYATRLAVSLRNGLEAGRVHPSRLTPEDLALVQDPRALPDKGLSAQAGLLPPVRAGVAAKGPKEAPAAAADRGVER